MATTNKIMKTFNVPSGSDTICYEIFDDKGRKCIAKDWYANSTAKFNAGEYVIKDGVCYRFTTTHAANTSWSSSEVAATNLGAELSDVKSALDSITEYSRNLFDKNSGNIKNVYPKTDGTNIFTGNTNARTVWIECEPNTTYTVSKIAGKRFAVTYGTAIPANNAAFEYVSSNNTAQSITVTTSATAVYLAAFVYLGGTDTETFENILNSVQIEKGSVPTEYVPYGLVAIDGNARATSEGNTEQINYIFGNDVGLDLIDKANPNVFSGYPNGTTNKYTSGNNPRTVWIECKPNTEYRIEKKSGSRFSVAYGSEKPANNAAFEYVKSDASAEHITVKTSATTKYLGAYVWQDTVDTDTFDTMLDTVHIYQVGNNIISKANNQVIFGNEMISDFAGMTAIGGATYSDGVWDLPENGGISTSLNVESGKCYFIEPTVDSVVISDYSTNETVNPLVITLGNASISIFANEDANWRVCLTPTTSGTVTLSLQCTLKLAMTVSGLTVKPIEMYAERLLELNDVEARVFQKNISIGNGHSKLTSYQSGNVAIGFDSQKDVNTGYANTAIGFQTQKGLTNGRANSAFGNNAQNSITTGMYNNAFGTVAQGYITSGCWNNAFGNEAQRDMTSGHNNTAMGRRAQSYLTTGCMNTAFGALAGFTQVNVSGHGGHGGWATKNANYQTLIGAQSIQNSSSPQDYATALGYRTVVSEKALALGANAEATGEKSVAIGYGVKATSDNEVVIGDDDSTVVIAGKLITFNQDGTVTWEAL